MSPCHKASERISDAFLCPSGLFGIFRESTFYINLYFKKCLYLCTRNRILVSLCRAGETPPYVFINSELCESLLGRKMHHLNLLTKLGKMTKTSLKRLLPKEFNAALLEKLTREGKVFIDQPKVVNKDAYKREVLDYVQVIDEYASEKWQEGIRGLWRSIVEAECFEDCLAMKNWPGTGHMNRYVVTNLVCMLRNKGVYQKAVTMESLHLQLEQTTKRNKYYSSNGNYCLSPEAKALLKQLLQRV